MENSVLRQRHGIFGHHMDVNNDDMRRVSVDWGPDLHRQSVCRAQSVTLAGRTMWETPGLQRTYRRHTVKEHHAQDHQKLQRNSVHSSSPHQHSISPQHNRSPPQHPTLALAKSLPTQPTPPATNRKLGVGKQKLSRTGVGGPVMRFGAEFRKKSPVSRISPVTHQRGKEDVNFDAERNFKFDDEISLKSDESNPEDHIYEEIDSDLFTSCDEEEPTENLLLGISVERRNNLKFYGSAGWDFGNWA